MVTDQSDFSIFIYIIIIIIIALVEQYTMDNKSQLQYSVKYNTLQYNVCVDSVREPLSLPTCRLIYDG